MNKKEKIIVIIASLGLAILLSFFLKKSSFLQKTEHQHLGKNFQKENNQQFKKRLPKIKKKKKAFVFLTTADKIIIIFVVILIMIIFLHNYFLRRRRYHEYLSGECFVGYTGALNTVNISFCPCCRLIPCDHFPITKEHKMFYDLDLLNLKIPRDLDEIYTNLGNEKQLNDFVQMIIDFFKLIDGHLLEAVYQDKNKKYKIINEAIRDITNDFNLNWKRRYHTTFYMLDIDNYQEDNSTRKKISVNDLQKEKDALTLFKKIVADEKITYWEIDNNQKFFLFEHYWGAYRVLKDIYRELNLFFEDQKNNFFKKIYAKLFGYNYEKDENDLRSAFQTVENWLINKDPVN